MISLIPFLFILCYVFVCYSFKSRAFQSQIKSSTSLKLVHRAIIGQNVEQSSFKRLGSKDGSARARMASIETKKNPSFEAGILHKTVSLHELN